jgi:regulator of sirC expression with transglutaminase-like and TPR domain
MLKDVNELIELEPKSALAYNTRGCIYLEQNHFELALSDFKKCIEIDPNDDVIDEILELHIKKSQST